MSTSVKQRFIKTHVIMLFIPIAVMGVLITLLVWEEIEERTHQQQVAAIDSVKTQVVDRHVRAIRNALTALADEEDLWRIFEDEELKEGIHEDWRMVQDIFPQRAWIYYGDTQGRITVVPQWEAPPEYDPRKRPWYAAAKEAGDFTWVTPYSEYITGETIFTASIPITNDRGEFAGVLSMDTFLKEFFEDMRSRALEESSELLVVTEGGNVISLAPDSPGVTDSGQIDEGYRWEEFFASSNDSRYIRLENTSYHAAYRELGPLPFYLVSLTPRKAIFAEILPLFSIIVTFTILALLVTGAGSIYIARYVVNNIRSLNEYMHEITRGVLSTKTCVSGEDEFLSLNRYMNDMVKTLAGQIESHRETSEELAVRNRQLDELVNVDGLTGITNYRHFYATLRTEWSRMQRERQPISLLFIDIDFFKQYNDYYGHQAGDECLKEFGVLLKDVTRRPADLAARYGGEEFVVLLPHTAESGAEDMALRIQDRLARLRIPHEQSNIAPHLTCSIGVVSTIPDSSRSIEEFIADADRAVYEAKNLGRNRIVVAAGGSFEVVQRSSTLS